MNAKRFVLAVMTVFIAFTASAIGPARKAKVKTDYSAIHGGQDCGLHLHGFQA